MREIQYEIVKEIAVLSTGDSGYKGNQSHFMEWERAEMTSAAFPRTVKKCGKGITLNADEAAALP